jgi:hypothetical protein
MAPVIERCDREGLPAYLENLDWVDLSIHVVDNGSSDGSAQMLAEAANAGLCSVTLDDRNLQHGPGLNRGLSALASGRELPEWVWILDSDCVVSRADALTAAISDAGQAAVVGESAWDPWMKLDRLEAYSLLIDPRRVWTAEVGPFADDGDPAWAILKGAMGTGLRLASFPFTEQGYVIHRGRSTLATIFAGGERSNPHYEWATDHHQPHFAGVPGAEERWGELVSRLRSEIPGLTGNALARACARSR